MKKLLGFSFSILILLSSCSTVNQPKFKNNTNHKELILSKYGESTIVKNDDNYETWVYDYGSFLKSNRNVIFNQSFRLNPFAMLRNFLPLALHTDAFLSPTSMQA